MIRKTLLALVTLGVLALAPVAAASAHTVNGACALNGTATFGSPLGGVPGSNTFTFSAGSGTCSGTLDGNAIANAPASAFASGSGTLGCTASVGSGGGTLTVNGTPVSFHLTFAGTGPAVHLVITGASGGGGAGEATFATGGTQPVLNCANNTASSLPFTVVAAAADLSG